MGHSVEQGTCSAEITAPAVESNQRSQSVQVGAEHVVLEDEGVGLLSLDQDRSKPSEETGRCKRRAPRPGASSLDDGHGSLGRPSHGEHRLPTACCKGRQRDDGLFDRTRRGRNPGGWGLAGGPRTQQRTNELGEVGVRAMVMMMGLLEDVWRGFARIG